LKQKWHILKKIPSYPTHTQKHIIVACMALHNFICDSLRDEEFDKCDPNKEYLLQQPSGMEEEDEVEDDEHEETMNSIRSDIADALVSVRRR
jgi:ADP-ribosylglycohydrolase